jgi:hypothetical protein
MSNLVAIWQIFNTGIMANGSQHLLTAPLQSQHHGPWSGLMKNDDKGLHVPTIYRGKRLLWLSAYAFNRLRLNS